MSRFVHYFVQLTAEIAGLVWLGLRFVRTAPKATVWTHYDGSERVSLSVRRLSALLKITL